MKTHRERYLTTSAFNLAVFLFANDQQISGINRTNDSERQDFVFVKNEFLEELVNLYKFGQKNNDRLLVNVHRYEQARQELLSLLKD